MKDAFMQATVQVIFWSCIIGVTYLIKRYIVGKYLRNYLHRKYPSEDAQRIEHSLSFGISIVFIVVFLFVILPKLLGV